MKHKFEHMLHQVAVDKEQEQTFQRTVRAANRAHRVMSESVTDKLTAGSCYGPKKAEAGQEPAAYYNHSNAGVLREREREREREKEKGKRG